MRFLTLEIKTTIKKEARDILKVWGAVFNQDSVTNQQYTVYLMLHLFYHRQRHEFYVGLLVCRPYLLLERGDYKIYKVP